MDFLKRLPYPLNSPYFFTASVGAALVLLVFKLSSAGNGKKPRLQEDLTKTSLLRDSPMKELPQLKVENTYRRGGDRRVSVAGESVTEEELNSSQKVVYEKSLEIRKRISDLTKKNLLFRNLDKRQKSDILDAMQERKVEEGEEIIKQGEEGDYFYVVDRGHFEILVNGTKVAESSEGGSFGELALLYNQPRAATVRATLPSLLWAVDRPTFRRLVLGSNVRKRQQYTRFLKEVSILSSLTDEERVKVVDALTPVSYEEGEVIIQEGEFGETFFIIEEGTVSVSIKGESVASKGKGEYFGEIALLTDGFRVATVTAQKGGVECLVLDKHAFVRLLGPCVDILKRNMENYQKFQDKVLGED